jgi:uncharacterized protein (TIGR03435 family)
MPQCRVLAGLPLLALLCLLPARAQLTLPKDGETVPSFEVATIKPAAPGSRNMMVQWMPDGYRIENISLGEIIRNAYNAHSEGQLTGGPQSLLDQRFDVLAKMDADAAAKFKALPRDDQQRQVDLMMQALLRDRFQLKMHVETRELPVYDLVVAKGGSKLQPTAAAPPAPPPDPGAEPSSPPAPPPPNLSNQLPRKVPHGTMMMRMTSTSAEMTVSAGTIDELAQMLTGQRDLGGRLIIDKTGLTGKYDYYLNWTPADAEMAAQSKGDDGKAPASDAPALFTALQEQLGLKLEPSKGQVQIVVLDSLQPPSPN